MNRGAAATAGERPPTGTRWAGPVIWVLIVSSALGPHLSLKPFEGAGLYGFRILGVLVLPLAVASLFRRTEHSEESALRAYRLLIWSYVIWAPLSLLWTPIGAEGPREIAGTLSAMLGGIALVELAKRGNAMALRHISVGWIAAFVAVGLGAVAERNFGVRFGDRDFFGATQSVLGNPNNLAAFLLLTFSYLLGQVLFQKKLSSRIIYLALTIWCLQLMTWTESRTVYLFVPVLSVLAGWWLLRTRMSRVQVGLLLASLLVVLLNLTSYGVSLNPGTSLGFSQAFGGDRVSVGREYVRENLAFLGVEYAVDSAFLGQGAASFEVLARDDAAGTRLDGIVNPHNVFIEVLAKYGLPVTIPLVALFWVLLKGGIRRRGTTANEVAGMEQTQFLVVAGAVCLMAAGLVASSVLTLPWWWMGVGSLTAHAISLTQPTRREDSVAPVTRGASGVAAGGHRD